MAAPSQADNYFRSTQQLQDIAAALNKGVNNPKLWIAALRAEIHTLASVQKWAAFTAANRYKGVNRVRNHLKQLSIQIQLWTDELTELVDQLEQDPSNERLLLDLALKGASMRTITFAPPTREMEVAHVTLATLDTATPPAHDSLSDDD